jgi:hypothetical protein
MISAGIWLSRLQRAISTIAQADMLAPFFVADFNLRFAREP